MLHAIYDKRRPPPFCRVRHPFHPIVLSGATALFRGYFGWMSIRDYAHSCAAVTERTGLSALSHELLGHLLNLGTRTSRRRRYFDLVRGLLCSVIVPCIHRSSENLARPQEIPCCRGSCPCGDVLGGISYARNRLNVSHPAKYCAPDFDVTAQAFLGHSA